MKGIGIEQAYTVHKRRHQSRFDIHARQQREKSVKDKNRRGGIHGRSNSIDMQSDTVSNTSNNMFSASG